MKKILGISAGSHDAAVSLINSNGEILFAGHSERYSKSKNDANLCPELLIDAMQYGVPDQIAFHERPWLKQLRRAFSGEGVEWDQLTARQLLKKQIPLAVWPNVTAYGHHLSHAAAGFQTSSFDRATVVVIDAIGELDTISIWGAKYINGRANYKKLWSRKYPHSIGLFYSAMTQRIGLKPNEDEYILMGMSSYGKPNKSHFLQNKLVEDIQELTFKENLHIGVDPALLKNVSKENIASSTQALCEAMIAKVMQRAKEFNWSTNLVYTGGVALNCSANRNLGEYFDNIWIMPNPGDAGSSLGAAALAYGHRLNWTDAFLGYNITGPYPVDDIISELLTNKICGVASGRAEFGPRALGNRSLLADPRGKEIKDQVNEIKQRQKFRPFAPVILEEYVHDYFTMPRGWNTSPYMQAVAQCKYPGRYPAIVHIDGTSRVQTVAKDGSGIRQLLEAWFDKTGCPMLLNTSLNVKGEPMINDRADADRFEKLYGVKVVS